MPCSERLSSTCDAGHKRSWKCSDGPPKICSECKREARLAKEKQEQELEEQKRREIEEREYLARLYAVNTQTALIASPAKPTTVPAAPAL
jgi:hypothetical protein